MPVPVMKPDIISLTGIKRIKIDGKTPIKIPKDKIIFSLRVVFFMVVVFLEL